MQQPVVLPVVEKTVAAIVKQIDGTQVKNKKLDEYAYGLTGSNISVKLTVNAQQESALDPSIQGMISETIAGVFSSFKPEQIQKEYLDLKVTKQIDNGVVELVGDVGRVIEVEIPYDFTNKYNVEVCREHNGTLTMFKRLDSRPEGGYVDGTFYIGNNEIFIYSQFFSTYTIAYTTVPGKSASAARSQTSIIRDGRVAPKTSACFISRKMGAGIIFGEIFMIMLLAFGYIFVGGKLKTKHSNNKGWKAICLVGVLIILVSSAFIARINMDSAKSKIMYDNLSEKYISERESWQTTPEYVVITPEGDVVQE